MVGKKIWAAGLAILWAGICYGSEGATTSGGWGPLAAAIAMGLGAFGAASGQGKAASAALEGIARNPSSKSEVFTPLLIALVFMEFQALMCFAIAFTVKG